MATYYYRNDKPAEPVIFDVGFLQISCDKYCDPKLSDVGGWRTCFDKEFLLKFEDKAKLCLERYNEQNKTSFILDEVVKLNICHWTYSMVFKAHPAETNTDHYFRGAVSQNPEVLLCEIKGDGDKGLEIPSGHDELYDFMASDNDDSSTGLEEEEEEEEEEEGGSSSAPPPVGS